MKRLIVCLSQDHGHFNIGSAGAAQNDPLIFANRDMDVDHTHVTFSAPVGKTWVVEASDSVATNAAWTTINAPQIGDDYFHEITDGTSVERRRFYRARGY